jgi:hypothetical protein
MKNNRFLIPSILLTGLLGLAASSSFAQTTAMPAAMDNQPAPMVLLVPVEMSNRALDAGCWAQFYDERNFKGDMLTMVGPASIDSMDKGTGKQLKRSIDSLVTGPKAMLTIYQHQMFKDKSAEFAPNSKEAGLINKLGFGGNIESLQLRCAN